MDLSNLRAHARGAWVGFRHPTGTKRRASAVEGIEVPPCPEGHAVAPPDFVGVGVMKAGTSWWYQLIVDHPEVGDVGGRPKEVHFFDRYGGVSFGDEDAARYHRYFPRPGGTIAGEWTPRYSFDFWTAPLLARAAPEVKCLLMLRDPVERFLSGLTQELGRGQRLSLRMLNEHFLRGLYAPQLRRLQAVIPPERLLVLQYEQCVADPVAELARTYEFLGVDARHRPEHLGDTVNPTWFDRPDFDDVALADMARAYVDEHGQLEELCPSIDLDRWSTTISLAHHRTS
ncbi:MAG: sulfotransferase [Acidimicrobiales bacterium]|nr:sulfotransferase [Acidimicrobiales bacterium]